MTESFIRKIQPDQDGLDFEGLRELGVKIAQEMSGDVWTDYNLHDPGVTILEALCYALTDLVYRTGFSAADYLATSDGSIDFKKQVLYRPDEILPCHPLTDNDYRKLILSAVPNIDNVWIRRDVSGVDEPQGLFQIYVQLSERVKNQDNEGVCKAYRSLIEKVYAANRNLCEDLAGIEIVKRIPYSLRGEIEVEGKREPANILAEIYFECAQYLSPRVPIHAYSEMQKNGHSLEQLLTGVLTGHGYIAEAELYPWRGHFSIPDLIGRISRIDGVKNINHLIFVDQHGMEVDPINLENEHSCLSVACLKLPHFDSEGEIKLYKAGKAYPVYQRDVEPEFNRLDFKHQALRQRKLRYDWVDAMLPKANFRHTSEYYSFQNHFPNAYGLNEYGIPDSAPPERKAQATQLKAYLLFFEQIMANFLQNLQEIPRLFSLEKQLKQSYFYQVLGNDSVPNIEGIYLNGVVQMDTRLAELVSNFDNYGDRRNRVLDYLLAIYGERFSQNSLHHFFAENTDSEEEKIANKIAFLQEIVEIGKERAAAFDYRKPEHIERNSAGLKKKLRLLLGLRTAELIALHDTSEELGLNDEDFHLVEHILLRPDSAVEYTSKEIPDHFYSCRISIIFPATPTRFSGQAFRNLAEETIYLNCPAHIHPEIFWLEPEPMSQFNQLYENWREAKCSAAMQPSASNEAARLLTLFLIETNCKANG